VTRPEPRVQALEALYAADTRGKLADLEALSARARRLVEGVWRHRRRLDEEIASVATGWRMERMPVIDRNLLRLGLYELRHTDTPPGVVISQAVELAKVYSTARSGRFVNGVLGRLVDVEDDTLVE
jgi:N utilization substance protein B